jgi:DNA-binding response OmpR family regulator
VLADLHLPGLSGPELVARLREHVPAVVAISGSELDAETATLVEAALAKPVELATIRATLADALRRHRPATA